MKFWTLIIVSLTLSAAGYVVAYQTWGRHPQPQVEAMPEYFRDGSFVGPQCYVTGQRTTCAWVSYLPVGEQMAANCFRPTVNLAPPDQNIAVCLEDMSPDSHPPLPFATHAIPVTADYPRCPEQPDICNGWLTPTGTMNTSFLATLTPEAEDHLVQRIVHALKENP